MDYLFDPANWEWVTAGNNLVFLLQNFVNNIVLAIIAMLFALLFGLGLALVRLSNNRFLAGAASLWTEVWRNLPVLLLILAFGLALPESVKEAWIRIAPGFLPAQIRDSGQVIAALMGLVLYNSAVIAEIFRAGILSLERGQTEASYALGLSRYKTMRLVVLPQGLRRMVPATVSQLITLTKDTSLVSILSIQEVVNAGGVVVATSGSPFGGTGVDAPILQVYIVVGAMFVVFNLILSFLSRRLEVRERRRSKPDAAAPGAANREPSPCRRDMTQDHHSPLGSNPC
jgi:glutamate transport system permease protein